MPGSRQRAREVPSTQPQREQPSALLPTHGAEPEHDDPTHAPGGASVSPATSPRAGVPARTRHAESRARA